MSRTERMMLERSFQLQHDNPPLPLNKGFNPKAKAMMKKVHAFIANESADAFRSRDQRMVRIKEVTSMYKRGVLV